MSNKLVAFGLAGVAVGFTLFGLGKMLKDRRDLERAKQKERCLQVPATVQLSDSSSPSNPEPTADATDKNAPMIETDDTNSEAYHEQTD